MPISEGMTLLGASAGNRTAMTVAAGLTATVAGYAVLGRDGQLYAWWFEGFAILAVLATLVAVARSRRVDVVWLLVLGGMLARLAADAAVTAGALDPEAAFPSLLDALRLGGDAAVACGLVLLARRRVGRLDAGGLLDLAIVAAVAVAAGWALLVQPNDITTDATALQQTIAVAYPVISVVTVALAIQLTAGASNTAGTLLTGSLILLVIGRSAVGFTVLRGWYATGNPVDVLFAASAVLWAAAMLEPSLAQLGAPAQRSSWATGRGRLAVLVVLALTTPFVIVADVGSFEPSEMIAFFLCFSTVVALVTSRLLVAVGRHLQLERREQALRQAAGRLVSARTRTEIAETAVENARRLGGDEVVAAALVLGENDTVELVAVSGETRDGLGALEAADVDEALDRVALAATADGAMSTVRIAHDEGSWSISPIVVQGAVRGGLVVRERRRRRGRLDTEVLETLAAQVGLALEAVARIEDLLERQAAERFRSLVQSSSDLILVVERDLTVRYHTPSVQRVLGHRAESLAGSAVTMLLHPDERDGIVAFLDEVAARGGKELAREFRLLRADGSSVVAECVIRSLLDDPNVRGYVITARDVTDRRRLEEELVHRAFHDPLTGLPNRALLLERIGQELARAQRGAEVRRTAVHRSRRLQARERHARPPDGRRGALQRCRKRSPACIRPSDTCARLGGDEFAVLVAGSARDLDPTAISARLLTALEPPLKVGDGQILVSASVGVAIHAVGGTANDLVRDADLAMYRAKASGKAHVEVFEPEMRALVVERLELKAELEHAVARGELDLDYQPIVRLDTEDVVGLEALLRWRHPTRGTLGPDTFIALAEESGLILPIGLKVLHDAAQQAALWRRSLGRPLGISVNLSACQLADDSLRGERCRHPRRDRATASAPDARAHRDDADGGARGSGGTAHRAACAGRAHRHRRLRHRLLVTRLPPSVPGGRAEGRKAVPRRDRPA